MPTSNSSSEASQRSAKPRSRRRRPRPSEDTILAAAEAVFGARGSGSFLSRATAVLATLFFVTSLTLAYFGGRPATQSSVMDTMAPAKIEAPAVTPSAGTESEPRQPDVPAPAEAPAK